MSEHQDGHHKHFILPVNVAGKILVALLILTVVTVLTAEYVDIGRFNFFLAMVIATVKASLVVFYFMGLKYDSNENRIVFFGSFVFVAIFFVLTFSDVLFRGSNWRAEKGVFLSSVKSTSSKFKKPWIMTSELVEHGKTVFQAQCTSCHGAEGKGDGPAAAALNPHPRNFTQATGWKKERKPTAVFNVVTKGLEGSAMASFGTLSSDDRWGVTHYVLSLGPSPLADTAKDFEKIGIDPNSDGGGADQSPTLPVDFAIELMAE